MKWSELFGRLPDRLKTAWSHEPAFMLRLEEGHDLYDLLTDRRHLKKTYESMSRAEQTALRQIVRHLGPLPFSEADYARLSMRGMSGAEARHALLGLRRKGAVLAMRKMWGERVFLIPWDTWSHWRRICFPDAPAPRPAAPDRVEPEPTGAGAAEDVFRLVCLVRAERPRLTQRGQLPRSFVRKAASRLSPGEECLERLNVRSSHAGDDPKPFLVTLDLALRLGLIGFRDGHAVVCDDRLAQWLDMGRAEQDAKLYELFRQVHLPAEIGFLHVADTLDSLPCGQWFAVRHLAGAAGWPDAEEDVRTREIDHGRLLEEWLKPLAGFGFVQLGTDEAGDVYVRRPEPAEAWADEWYVQDDFEIIALPHCSFRLRWELEMLADVSADEGVVRGRLDRSSVWKACGMGWSADDLIGRLRAFAAAGVPAQVEQAVRQWAGEYGRARIVDATLLRCRDEQSAEELARVPALQGILLERIGGKDFLVDAARRQELLKWLREAGYGAREEQHAGTASGIREEQRTEIPPEEKAKGLHEREPAGLLLASLYVPRYDWESELPDERELYPDLSAVPHTWMRELRTYHDSTRKEVIRRAIALEAPLRLRLDGKLSRWIPRRIEEGQGDWHLVAIGADGRERRFGRRDWEEMQLILPGINDTKDVDESPF